MNIFSKESAKKNISLTLATVFAAGTIVGAVPVAGASTGLEMPSTFTETPAQDAFMPRVSLPTDITGNWANSDIVAMLALGAVKGYPDKMFRPSKAVTRAEFAAATERALYLPKPEDDIELRDVSEKHWALKSIQKAVGFLPAYPDGSFRPSAPATREDVAAALVLATGLDKKTVDATSIDLIFKDYKTVSPDLRDLIAIAVDQKLIKGYRGDVAAYDATKHQYREVNPDGTEGANGYNLYIKAQNFVTRAEMVHLLNKARENVSLGFKLAPGAEE
ncbi:MAG: S-layer homology domain-containing protein [Candidatus Aquicultor sp.]|nr:S-layer homology domain-containing protein [Candidatus Aquicultor sp.]